MLRSFAKKNVARTKSLLCPATEARTGCLYRRSFPLQGAGSYESLSEDVDLRTMFLFHRFVSTTKMKEALTDGAVSPKFLMFRCQEGSLWLPESYACLFVGHEINEEALIGGVVVKMSTFITKVCESIHHLISDTQTFFIRHQFWTPRGSCYTP